MDQILGPLVLGCTLAACIMLAMSAAPLPTLALVGLCGLAVTCGIEGAP